MTKQQLQEEKEALRVKLMALYRNHIKATPRVRFELTGIPELITRYAEICRQLERLSS